MSISNDRLDKVLKQAQLDKDDIRNEVFPDLIKPGECPPWRAEELDETTYKMSDPCPRCGGDVGVVFRRGKTRCHQCKLDEPKRNAASTSARGARRRATENKAVPADLTEEDWQKIRDIYALRDKLTRETGIPHHVDHIIPLSQGGLHHWSNLQVLPAKTNIRKGNKMPNGILPPKINPKLPPDLFSF